MHFIIFVYYANIKFYYEIYFLLFFIDLFMFLFCLHAISAFYKLITMFFILLFFWIFDLFEM